MFIIGEYAVCVFVAVMLATLVLAACGIGYLLKAIVIMFVRALSPVAYRALTLKWATRFSSGNVNCTGAKTSVIADCPS